MEGMISEWWVWAVAALVLGILEMLAPGFILLGFALGAGAMAILLAIFGSTLFAGNIAAMLAVFAILSLISWFVLRSTFKLQRGSVKVWEKDINDDV